MATDNNPEREREKEKLRSSMVVNDRIQSAPEVWLRRHRKGLLILALALAFVAVGTFAFRFVADRLWTHTSYRVLWEHMLTGAESSEYLGFAGGTAIVTRDGVRFVDSGGKQRWNTAFDMVDPTCAVRSGYLLVYDCRGQSFVICTKDGKAGGGVTSLPITGGDIAATGVCVLRTEEATASILSYYRSSGEALKVSIRSPLGDQGYPLDFSVSDNGQQLAISYYNLSGGRGSCRVVFYDFEKGDEKSRQTASFDYSPGGEYIPSLTYSSDTSAYAVTDRGLKIYNVSDRRSITQSSVDVEGQIRSVFADRNYIGLIVDDGSSRKIRVYAVDGTQKAVLDTIDGFTHYFFQDDNVGMYAEHRCRLVSFTGRIRFDLDFLNSVYAFLPGKTFGNCVLATMGELQGIRLR